MEDIDESWQAGVKKTGPRRNYISEVKPDAMGKIQPAHELAWFLCVMGSSGNQASTRLSESGSGFRAICVHKFKGAVIVMLHSKIRVKHPQEIACFHFPGYL
uniref:Uncharacterized protein n=1 Tax=Magallana gigas TaxID=29159 RepID=K1PB97_MAGGI